MAATITPNPIPKLGIRMINNTAVPASSSDSVLFVLSGYCSNLVDNSAMTSASVRAFVSGATTTATIRDMNNSSTAIVAITFTTSAFFIFTSNLSQI
jgi:hypothetical protein